MLITPSMVNALHQLAQQAGAVIMPHFQVNTAITRKQDGSPVTLADQASEDVIIDGLTQLTPDIPVIAEEQAEANTAPDLNGRDTFWLVDPLDGTKEFIKGSSDFCINIGLIRDGEPAFGAVYCPATGDFYYGGLGLGAYLNGTPLTPRPFDPQNGLTIVGTENYKNNVRLIDYLGQTHVTGYVTRGSTLKFFLLAEGQADLYARFVPTYEWDTAAAHAILLELGADIIDFHTRERLTYHKKNFRNGPLVAAPAPVLDYLAEI